MILMKMRLMEMVWIFINIDESVSDWWDKCRCNCRWCCNWCIYNNFFNERYINKPEEVEAALYQTELDAIKNFVEDPTDKILRCLLVYHHQEKKKKKHLIQKK